MDKGHERRVFQALEKSMRESGTGLRLLHIISGTGCFPPDEGMMQVVIDCRALGIDVLATEADGRRLLVAGQVYDDVFAVSLLPENVPAVTAARYLQRLLTSDSLLRPEERLLPASDTSLLLKRWEWQVSVIFGPRFAARLVEAACNGQSGGHMTSESLDQVRRYLIRATCGSVDFTEST
jgi:hypothetical protein